MKKIYEVITSVLSTKGEKARAAADLGQILKLLGVRHGEAARLAGHELKHAIADNKEGRLGIIFNRRHELTGTFYKAKVWRTPRELLKILKAPGKDMSLSDKVQALIILPFVILEMLISLIKR